MITFIKDELHTLIHIEKLSYLEIGRLYGCSDTLVKRRAKQLGIELPKRRTINPSETFDNKVSRRKLKSCVNSLKYKSSKKYCSTNCQTEFEYNDYIRKWKSGETSGTCVHGSSKHIRKYLFLKYDNQCCKCGWSVTHPVTGKIPLELHHVDGNYKNNSEDNLELLCPNCHALTPNYKALNKSSDGTRYKAYFKDYYQKPKDS
jgi:hypothetical protein